MATASKAPMRYDPRALDRKWRERWDRDGLYQVSDEAPRQKWYALTMYPYPSGDLHIGHWYAISPADAYARFMRMRGYNVLFPMGFDAFGLPAENAAIKNKVDPREWTYANMERMREQLRSMGAMFDWSREVVTCDPGYYRWNQWLFNRLFENGLAYRALAAVNWCPGCQTVLANEQVIDGRCERSDDVVIRREMVQWFFRMTAYADELLDFSGVTEWPERIMLMQRNWIGRSEGVQISFPLEAGDESIEAFTTRIDTIYGATFLAIAPEHPLTLRITTPGRKADVEAYIARSREETEIERLSVEREKTGVHTGAYAINRLNGERIPILVADYVLPTYGTGAVMGVPAHDERDFSFAKKYGLEIRVVVAPPGWRTGDELEEAYVDKAGGAQVNSGEFDGLPSQQGYEAIADKIEAQGWGRRTTTYRMRDWLISRQRYWGTPIPIVYCGECGVVPIPDEQLPVLLPEGVEFLPTGESPLKRHDEWVRTTCPQCGGPATRETDTMDTFVDSSWYFLRYLSANDEERIVDPASAAAWCPVDQYMGGAEHAVMHLLYARWFTKAMRDLSIIDFDEPFLRLFNQGVILSGHAKMSKSRGNVIAPDDYVRELGADVVRLYLMFLGPWESGGDWSDTGINGIARWVNRVWDLAQRDATTLPASNVVGDRDLTRLVHQTVRRVITDIDRFKFNTAIAALMALTNELAPAYESASVSQPVWSDALQKVLLLLAPMAPHFCEELWERTGNAYSIHHQPLPEWDDELAAIEEATLIVQVNGKLRDRMQVSADIDELDAKQIALASERVRSLTDGKTIDKVVYVPGRYLVSVVVRG